MVKAHQPNEIRLVRVYDSPVQAVWEAWTDPEQVAKWWGPRGFTLTTHHKDLRVGGVWKYTMHGPDGTDYPNLTVYHEVEEHRKLVYDHGGSEDRPPLFRVTVWFSEADGKTTMDMTMALATAEQAEATRKFIKAAGGNSTWDRLAEYLDDQASGRQCFFINRSFEATAEQLFDVWTDPAQLSQWLPPTGFNMDVLRADIREGGTSFYRMSNAAGVTLYGQSEYQELSKPSRIVYIQRFCDEHENISRHPGLPVFPAAMLVTVDITSEDDAWTRVTVTSEPLGAVSAEEVAAFVQLRSGMTQGWTGSFDQLESLLLNPTIS